MNAQRKREILKIIEILNDQQAEIERMLEVETNEGALSYLESACDGIEQAISELHEASEQGKKK